LLKKDVSFHFMCGYCCSGFIVSNTTKNNPNRAAQPNIFLDIFHLVLIYCTWYLAEEALLKYLRASLVFLPCFPGNKTYPIRRSSAIFGDDFNISPPLK